MLVQTGELLRVANMDLKIPDEEQVKVAVAMETLAGKLMQLLLRRALKVSGHNMEDAINLLGMPADEFQKLLKV